MAERAFMKENFEISSSINDLLKKKGYPEETIKTVIRLYSQPTSTN